MSSLRSEIEALEGLLSHRTRELEKSQKRASELEGELGALKYRFEASNKAEFTRLKREIDHRDQRISKLMGDLDRLDKKRSDFAVLLDQRESEDMKKIEKYLDTVQKEISRYRRERDEMREMYENANSQVASLGKQCSHLQIMIESLKSKISILESKQTKLNEAISSGQLNDDALLSELETIERAFQTLQEQNETLMKEAAAKEAQLSAALSEKMKLEFKISQALKEAEVAGKNASELENIAISKVNQSLSREKALLSNLADAEKGFGERGRQLDELRKKISDMSTSVGELERTNRSLRGELEEPIFVDLRHKYNDCLDELSKIKENSELLEKRYAALKRRQQPGSTEAEEELAMYKKLLRCNSCHTREKNAVLAKCMHVFCRKCLEDRIETRQRKCPNCGEAFSATDIRTIYL